MGPSMRRPTIDDVAQAAGVSRAAVSKVLREAYGVSDDMRARVGRAIEELGYRPRVAARAMRGTTSTIGIMVPISRTSFFDDVLAGASRQLDGSGYQLILAAADAAHRSGQRALEALADRQVDGVIALSPMVEPAWLEEYAKRTPLVELGRHDETRYYDTVVGDDTVGAEQVMRHLLENGHTAILHVTHDDPVINAPTPPSLRRAAYERTMKEAGLAHEIDVVLALFDERIAAERMRAALEAGSRPTAIFAGNDDAALGVLRAIAEFGLDPRGIAVCGYDNSRIASHPLIQLTSVDQEGERMGQLAAQLLLERFGGRTQACREVIVPQLIVRSSSLGLMPR
ncbi:LacI family DNA-binding transcriptional regulator [Actinoplanes sp. NPDC051411]|uniref:LacI family DNA-binding transcriptional regulator n=1 Tax=Actinoplanes sp. NPDC051411 TaxID=3155522 RepID=UPI003414B2F6